MSLLSTQLVPHLTLSASEEEMPALNVFFCLAFSCLLSEVLSHGHPTCYSHVNWNDLLEDLYKLEDVFNSNCEFSPSLVICEPKHVLQKVRYDKVAISHILSEMIQIFSKKEFALPQMRRVRMSTSEALRVFAKAITPADSEVHESVQKCFQNMNHFLVKESNSSCAWDKVLHICREFIQRVENCASRSK